MFVTGNRVIAVKKLIDGCGNSVSANTLGTVTDVTIWENDPVPTCYVQFDEQIGDYTGEWLVWTELIKEAE